MRDTRLRPSDILIYDYNGSGKHLMIDVAVTSAVTNTGMAGGRWKTAGENARAYERRKINRALGHRITLRGSWSYVPFILEDCGRPGAHAVSLLADLDERRSHNDFVGLPVSLKARMLQVVSTVLHTSRSQLVLSKGVLKP